MNMVAILTQALESETPVMMYGVPADKADVLKVYLESRGEEILGVFQVIEAADQKFTLDYYINDNLEHCEKELAFWSTASVEQIEKRGYTASYAATARMIETVKYKQRRHEFQWLKTQIYGE